MDFRLAKRNQFPMLRNSECRRAHSKPISNGYRLWIGFPG